MQEKLAQLKKNAEEEIAQINSSNELNSFKVKIFGKKGLFNTILQEFKQIYGEQKPLIGKSINTVKEFIEKRIEERSLLLGQTASHNKTNKEFFDYSLPGRKFPSGNLHPITQTLEQVIDIFSGLGFQIAEGTDIETDYYNFEALNIPKDHPARDMQDTFYLFGENLLRTHTSPVQIHVMEKSQPPLRVIAPGKVYRCDSDITHTPMFHQVEGFMVDKDICFSHLKGVLELFVNRMFGEETSVRFRPSYFPFTEPSAEVDIQCVMCHGAGCRVCSQSGWLEILGAGMINPKVFNSVNYDPEIWSGFAFGMGIERIAMLKYGINDIRLFFENDVRFLSQF